MCYVSWLWDLPADAAAQAEAAVDELCRDYYWNGMLQQPSRLRVLIDSCAITGPDDLQGDGHAQSELAVGLRCRWVAGTIMRLRTGTSVLRADTGVFERPALLLREQRVCRLCAGRQVEDLQHVLLQCPAVALARQRWRHRIHAAATAEHLTQLLQLHAPTAADHVTLGLGLWPAQWRPLPVRQQSVRRLLRAAMHATHELLRTFARRVEASARSRTTEASLIVPRLTRSATL